MNSERIKEIQQETAYPNSVSVQQALLQVWNECEQQNKNLYSEEEVRKMLDDATNYVSAKEMRDNYEMNFSEWKRMKEWFVDYLFEQFKKK